MSYETSYDAGGKPFKPDRNRGQWSNPNDFILACVNSAFRMDMVYGVAAVAMLAKGGISVLMIIACVFIALLYSVPITFVQSFLGQFSTSGFISVFRVAPLFKGLGYVGLSLNVLSLTFYSTFAAVPLVFLIYSLQPTLPWSCEAVKGWSREEEEKVMTHCELNETVDEDVYQLLQVPSVEYFSKMFAEQFSFVLLGCMIAVWVAIAFTLNNTTETIGRIIRYSTTVMLTMLFIVFVRMLFLPGAVEGVAPNKPNETKIQWELLLLFPPLFGFSAFGPGWGTVLSMASYNKFKANTARSSWIISVSQVSVLLMIGIVFIFSESHLTKNISGYIIPSFELQWLNYLVVPSAIASMSFPHLWSWMFFSMLVIGSFNLMLVQMFSVVTALFDEFEELRAYRKEVIFGISAVLAAISGLFCTSHGISLVEILGDLGTFSQCLLNLFLLIIVLWIYGKERFQRDVEFMTSQVLATWKLLIGRIVAPLCMAFSLLMSFTFAFFHYRGWSDHIEAAMALSYSPWLLLPGYCIYKLLQTNGTVGLRFRRCTRPTDWYPIDAEDRQRYEETMDNPETSQALTAIVL